MNIPDRLVDIMGHIPFLLVTYQDDQGKHRVGFNTTRIAEMLVAIIAIVYFLSKQVSSIESKIDLIAAKSEIERAQTRDAIAGVLERVKTVEERLYEHNARLEKGEARGTSR